MSQVRTDITIQGIGDRILLEFQVNIEAKLPTVLPFFEVWNFVTDFVKGHRALRHLLMSKKFFAHQIFLAVDELERRKLILKHMKNGKDGEGQRIDRLTLTELGKEHLKNVRYMTIEDIEWERKVLEAKNEPTLNLHINTPSNLPLTKRGGINIVPAVIGPGKVFVTPLPADLPTHLSHVMTTAQTGNTLHDTSACRHEQAEDIITKIHARYRVDMTNEEKNAWRKELTQATLQLLEDSPEPRRIKPSDIAKQNHPILR